MRIFYMRFLNLVFGVCRFNNLVYQKNFIAGQNILNTE